MSFQIRAAYADDVPGLVALMQAFYAEAGLSLPEQAAAAAFRALVERPDLGRVWIADAGGELLGHAVLTMCFSMEYGGLRGFVDDLYVRREARGRGVAAALLAAVRDDAVSRGVRGLAVEVGDDDGPARRVYSRAGYHESERKVMTLALASPLHTA